MAKKKAVEPESNTIDLGASTELPTTSSLIGAEWNFILIHRHHDPLMQWWGNMCSKLVSYVTVRAADEKPIRWYHEKMYNFGYKQYDKYGDYYRIIDNSFGEANDDDIYEVR